MEASNMPLKERIELRKQLEERESNFMRMKRQHMTVKDFTSLNIIGRGAFGEVLFVFVFSCLFCF